MRFVGDFFAMLATSSRAGIQKLKPSGVTITPSLPWTNMPAAATIISSSAVERRAAIDLTERTEVRLLVSVMDAGHTTAVMGCWYSLNGGATKKYFLAGGNGDNAVGADGPKVDISSTGLKDSGWVTIPAEARAPVLIGCTSSGGNGAADPSFSIRLEAR